MHIFCDEDEIKDEYVCIRITNQYGFSPGLASDEIERVVDNVEKRIRMQQASYALRLILKPHTHAKRVDK